MAIAACALTGCWEEIHYTPPQPDAAPSPVAATTPPAADAEANTASEGAVGDFGDDVAQSLADQSLAASGEIAPIADVSEPSVETPTTNGDAAAATSKSRLAAWSLGSTLSLAALANDRAASEDKVTRWFNTARQQAEVLGTTVADLPPRPADDRVDMEGTRAMEYLFSQGQVIGPHLAQSLGDDHNALFEVALKSNILLVRYQPDAPVSKLLSAAISQASERAKLPPELVQPVLQAVEAQAPVKNVRDAVFDMHERVDNYLSTGQL